MVLKFKSGSVFLLEDGASALVNYNGTGVYFTSYRDDARKGDTNGDGRFTVSDATSILFHVFGDHAIACLDAADVNDDGSVNVSDATGLLRYLFSHGPAPAAPFPFKGVDATLDQLPCDL